MSTPESSPAPPADPERPAPRASGRQFRPSTPADAAAIATLLREAGLRPVVRPDVEQWKYWRAHGDWPASRSYVLTDHGSLVAHGAIIPGVLAWGKERLSIVQVVDWAARADAAGAGLSLMKRLSRLADGAIAIGGSAHTRQILPHLGFKPITDVTGHVRPLRPLRMLGTGGSRAGWRLLPRFARSVLWAARARSGGGEQFTVRQTSVDGLASVLRVLPAPNAAFAVFERSEAQLRHALECPLVTLELHTLERAARLEGYFLLAIAGRQARLADWWLTSREPADWRAVIQCAVRQARRHPGVAELIAWSSDTLFTECLAHCGFHLRNTQQVSLMIRPGHAAPPNPLRVQMLETDAMYLNPRGENLWS